MTPTKQELITAALTFIRERAGNGAYDDEYVEPYTVAGALIDQGLLDHEDLHQHRDSLRREEARRKLTAKVKRLLDQAAAQADAPILRFSYADRLVLPRLNGSRRKLYGATVGYTTPDVYERACAAVAKREAEFAAAVVASKELVERAVQAGLPMPVEYNTARVSYTLETFQAIVERWEARQ